MDEPFTYLDWKRNERAKHLQKLLALMLSHDLATLIVKTRRTILFESRRFHDILLMKTQDFCVYAVAAESHIPKAVSLMARIGLWHQPIFHLLVIPRDSIGDIGRLLERNPWLTLEEINENFPDQGIGYIQPLDDILECYGTEVFEKAVESMDADNVR